MFEDIKWELSYLACWKMTSVRRKGNHVAHKLARFAVLNSASETWHGAVPGCLHKLVALVQLALRI
jgi:hypothetical protein